MVDWGLGKYERIAEQLRPAAKVVVDTADPVPGETLVDIGCGTGNAALLAAERGATVIGVDPVQRLLEKASAAAEERDLDAEFVLGEAASMPVSGAEADAVVSVFGVIFAEDPAAAAAEIARVTAQAGRVVLAAWVPGGAISDAVRLNRETLAEILGEPPAAALFAWHELEALSGLFEPYGFSVSLTEHELAFSAPTIDQFMRIEGENHPLAVAARPVLEGAGRADEVRDGMRRIYEEANEDPAEFRITSRYVVAEIRRPA
ncbi:MAG TPA: class I SAM-dependent methyltransferase [Solirubrobacterales bacterium]|nr:class I SAM-dependent methyltransferase [Solirubrobacterales bacterium]